MMDEKRTGSTRSRRRFLGAGASALAGGLVGGAVYATGAGASQSSPGAPPALPWPWRHIDPMEAGSRAYRYYLDLGG
jgi:hypothetical protein